MYNNLKKNKYEYLNMGLSDTDILRLKHSCKSYKINRRYYHVFLDVAKNNYEKFLKKEVLYCDLLKSSAGIDWAFLNDEILNIKVIDEDNNFKFKDMIRRIKKRRERKLGYKY